MADWVLGRRSGQPVFVLRDFTPRWAAIGFIGAGRAWGRNTEFGDVGSAVAKGVGVRYLIARKLGLWVGVDYARGPEGKTGYIQVGSAWR